jgi:phosphoglycolate phosphatase
MIKAVVFDLDGTLVPFTLDVNKCRTQIIQSLIEQKFPSSLFSTKETAFDMLLKIKKYLKTKGSEDQNFITIKKMVFSTVEQFELKAAKTTKIFAGIPETLKALRDMNLKLALCTISGEKATDQILNRFDIKHYFEVVIPRESVLAVKPNPLHLKAALAQLNARYHEVVLVGDSVKDMTCAYHLKVIAIGVTTGLSSKEQLIEAGAHYVISSVNDLTKLIPEVNKQLS